MLLSSCVNPAFGALHVHPGRGAYHAGRRGALWRRLDTTAGGRIDAVVSRSTAQGGGTDGDPDPGVSRSGCAAVLHHLRRQRLTGPRVGAIGRAHGDPPSSPTRLPFYLTTRSAAMERLIPGATCWWAVGTHRVARLPLDAMDERGRLQPEAASALASARLCQPADPDLYHVTVLITTRCNLGCSYCFQNTDLPQSGLAGPSVRVPSLVLDDAATDRVMAFARWQMAARGASKLDLVLFGGEPAMYPRACLGLLSAASELGLVRAAMYSNGTLLTPRIAAELAR